MKSVELMKTAQKIVSHTMQIKPGEKVCVVTDTNKWQIAETLMAACHAAGAETVMAVMAPRDAHGNELPAMMAAAMAGADVILAPTTYAITHTNARIQASKNGARTLILRGITEDTMVRGAITADYDEVYELTSRVAERLTAANEVLLTSDKGTYLTLSIKGRKGLVLGGLARNPGEFTSLPTGEAPIVPIEGSAEGVIVADHSIDGVGVLSEPVTLTVKKGIVTSIEGGRQAEVLRQLLAEAGDNAHNLAEFAIGTNAKSRLIGNMAEDKILRGTVHIAMGDSHTIGGIVKSSVHLDAVILNPTVELDGVRIVENRHLLMPEK